MDIMLDATSAITSDSITAYQDSRKLSRTVVSQSAASLGGQSNNETSKDTDTVEISEEARRQQQQHAAATSEDAITNQAQETADGSKEEDSTSTRAMLLKQIQKVKEQLNDANSRLVAATSKSKSASNSESGGISLEEKTDTEGKDASGAKVSEDSQDPEVKTIMSEINQLTATLVTLNAQLLKEEQKGGAAGTTGTAGINEGSGLSGGLGERLPVKA